MRNFHNSLLSRFVILPESGFRNIWNVLFGLLLIYVATVFPYKLCLLEYALKTDGA